MPTDRAIAITAGPAIRIEGSTLVTGLVAAAMLSSSIVFSEPALVDGLMLLVIVAVPLLGAAKVRTGALFNLCLLLVAVACGVVATGVSATFDTAIKHQLVTLYLVLGGFALTAYIAQDPLPRVNLVFWCYTLGCAIAAAAAIAGYFSLVPGANDLFTKFGRARGTFKDANVFGGALVPAVLFCTWQLLRNTGRPLRYAAMIAVPIALGLLLSFSRGAWISLVLAAVLMIVVGWLRTRRQRDSVRLMIVMALGGAVLIAGLATALQFEAVQTLLEERATLDQSYDQGPDGRFGGQAKAMQLILANPLGIGTHTFRDIHHLEEPHNVYLSMFLNAGWLGGFAYLASVVLTLGVGLRAALRMSSLQGPILCATAAFAAFAIEGLIVDTDHWRSFFIVQACVWGLAQAPEHTPVHQPGRAPIPTWRTGRRPKALHRH